MGHSGAKSAGGYFFHFLPALYHMVKLRMTFEIMIFSPNNYIVNLVKTALNVYPFNEGLASMSHHDDKLLVYKMSSASSPT